VIAGRVLRQRYSEDTRICYFFERGRGKGGEKHLVCGNFFKDGAGGREKSLIRRQPVGHGNTADGTLRKGDIPRGLLSRVFNLQTKTSAMRQEINDKLKEGIANSKKRRHITIKYMTKTAQDNSR